MVINKIIPNEDEKLFLEFAEDHIKHFNTIPCEFVTQNGKLWNLCKCWKIAKKHGLNKMIIKPLNTFLNKKIKFGSNECYYFKGILTDIQKVGDGIEIIMSLQVNGVMEKGHFTIISKSDFLKLSKEAELWCVANDGAHCYLQLIKEEEK